MKLFNGTTHEICFYSEEDTEAIQDGRKLVLKEGALPLMVIPPGVNLSAKTEQAPLAMENDDVSCPPLVGPVVFAAVDDLPQGYDIYIVSNLYRSAYREINGQSLTLATVYGTVYDSPSAKRPCGCLALAVG